MAKRQARLRPSGRDDTAAIDSGLAKGRLSLEAGTFRYAPSHLVVPDGASIIGRGIGKTIVLAALEVGSHARIGNGLEAGGVTFGRLTNSRPHQFKTGAEASVMRFCRFRAPDSDHVWNLNDYTGLWTDPVRKRYCEVRDVVWSDCEFEYVPGAVVSIWWDCRAGGGNVSGLVWRRTTFSAMNQHGSYAPTCTFLMQPSPPEHGPDGPRPSAGWNGKCANPNFDWSQVTHGAGTASLHVAARTFVMWDCYFPGASSFASFDLCDELRSWLMCRYYADKPLGWSDNGTQAEQDSAPDSVTNKGWRINRTHFGGQFCQEIGRDVVVVDSPDYRGDEYQVPDHVKAHDRELYAI